MVFNLLSCILFNNYYNKYKIDTKILLKKSSKYKPIIVSPNKKKCITSGLKRSGSKDELIERLFIDKIRIRIKT